MKQYQLERRNPKTGFHEKVVYTGSLSQKPTGWRVVREIQPNRQLSGLV